MTKKNWSNYIISPNKYGPCTKKQIKKFEDLLGSGLPTDYKEFLMQCNGGRPKSSWYKDIKSSRNYITVLMFYGFAEEPEWFSIKDGNNRIDWNTNELSDMHLKDFFACGDGDGSVIILLNLKDELVYLYNYSGEFVGDNGLTSPILNTGLTFSDFFFGLLED